MFTIDTTITDLKVREKNILKILFSMNIHQVATPEMMLEDARSYVLFFRESRGKLFAYIALHLLTTDRKLYYSCSDNPFPDDEMEAVEEEALTFLEGLGAMIDEVNFSNMSDSAQDRWLNDQEMFSEKPAITETRPAEAIVSEVMKEAEPQAAPIQSEPVVPTTPQPVAAPIAAPVEPQPVAAPVAAPIEPQPVAAPVAAPIEPQPIIPPAPQPVAAPIQPQPVSAPVPPIAAPVQTQPQPTPVPPPVTPSVQPVLAPVHAEPVVTPALKPVVPTVTPTAPRAPLQQQQQKQQQKTALKRPQEATPQAVKPNVVKTSVMPQSREVQPAAGIVSRDKEALARLLASF